MRDFDLQRPTHSTILWSSWWLDIPECLVALENIMVQHGRTTSKELDNNLTVLHICKVICRSGSSQKTTYLEQQCLLIVCTTDRHVQHIASAQYSFRNYDVYCTLQDRYMHVAFLLDSKCTTFFMYTVGISPDISIFISSPQKASGQGSRRTVQACAFRSNSSRASGKNLALLVVSRLSS